MNNPNSELQSEETSAEAEPVETEALEPQPIDGRRRLRELLSIPERDRSDEQWDEIIELEIQMAPGNRISPNESGGGGQPRYGKSAGTGGGGGGMGGGANAQQQKKHRPRTKNTRRPRQNKPPTSGGGTPA